MRSTSRSAWLPAIGLVLSIAPAAVANVAATSRPAEPAGMIAVQRGTPIAVEREELAIECHEQGGYGSCSFVASYYLVNTSATPARATVAFWGAASNVELAWRGQRSRTLSSNELDAITRSLAGVERPPLDAPKPAPTGLDVSLDPEERDVLVSRGDLNLGWSGGRGYSTEPVHARHGLVQPARPHGTHHEVSYYLSPIRSFRSVGPITIRVSHPSGWSLDASLEEVDGTQQDLQFRDGSTSIPADRARMLRLSFDRSRSFHPGGPLFGVGGAFGDGGGLRLRAGWEIAAPSWLFYSVTGETNAEDLWIVSPLVEAASDQVLVIPSFGFGVGVPIQIAPETAIGARIQATMSLSRVGLVSSLDWFPSGDAGDGEMRVALLGYLFL